VALLSTIRLHAIGPDLHLERVLLHADALDQEPK
jgi:hypothetical protein